MAGLIQNLISQSVDFCELQQVDRVCRQFETERSAGTSSTIEDYLTSYDGAAREILLCELVAIEWELRSSAGESPSIEEYVARFSDQANAIRAAISESDHELRACASPTTPLSLPTTLGDYRILREIGRGGMGVVYEAVQESLGRTVALKLLIGGGLHTESRRARFIREARAVGRLHHGHIVEIYGTAEDDGCCYLTMRFIEGRPLSTLISQMKDACDEGSSDQGHLDTSRMTTRDDVNSSAAIDLFSCPQTLDERVRFVARIGHQLADALQHASSRGVLHRDVKPSNILIDESGDAFLTDFGLARVNDDIHDLTATGELIGTPRYLPPESLTGKTDERGDIYGLGISLYELLLLRKAFDETDRIKLLRQITETTVTRPRMTEPAVPADLETILLKCIARMPCDRYQVAGELAEDFRRFLADEPIRARRLSPVARLHRWGRRNRALASSLVAVFLLLICMVIGTGAAALWLNDARDEAEQNATLEAIARRREASARQAHESELVCSLIHQARALRLSNEAGARVQILTALERARELPAHNEHLVDLRSEFVAIHARPGIELDYVTPPLDSLGLRSLSFHPNGQLLMMASYGKEGQVWDVTGDTTSLALEISTPEQATTVKPHYGNRTHIPAAEFLADGTAMALLSSRGPRRLRFSGLVRDTTDGPNFEVMDALTIDPDDERRTTAKAFAVDARGMRMAVTWAPPKGRMPTCIVDVYALSSGERLLAIEGLKPAAHKAVTLSPDGEWLAYQHDGSTTVLRRVAAEASKSQEKRFEGRDCRRLRFSPDGSRLATGADDGIVRVIEVVSGKVRHTTVGHRGPVNDVVFSPDSRFLASVGDDGFVRLWEAATGSEICKASLPDFSYMTSVAFGPAGDRLAIGFQRFALFSVHPGRWGLPLVPPLQVPGYRELMFDSEGNLLVVPTSGYHVLHERESNWRRHTVVREKHLLRDLSLRPQGDWLAVSTRAAPGHDAVAGSQDVVVWNVASEVDKSRRYQGVVSAHYVAGFSPSGDQLVAYDATGQIVVWDFESSAPKLSVSGPPDPDLPMEFTADDRAVFVSSKNGTIARLDLNTGALITSETLTNAITDIELTEDGRLLLVCLGDQIVSLDSRSLKQLQTTTPIKGGASQIETTRDGSIIAVLRPDRTVTVHSPNGEQLLRLPAFVARVRGLRFHPTSKKLYIYGHSQAIFVWDLVELRAGLEALSLGW